MSIDKAKDLPLDSSCFIAVEDSGLESGFFCHGCTMCVFPYDPG